jgi:hypothetical protein
MTRTIPFPSVGIHTVLEEVLVGTTDLKDSAQSSTVEINVASDSPDSERVFDVNDESHWLTVSPYLEPEHWLDLRTVDVPYQLLALALTKLEPATSDYATVNYEDALDWASVMSHLRINATRKGYRWRRQEFYVVEFRSKLKQKIDNELLFKLDKESHVEATASGGLLKYWYGVPDTERRNLATCK